MADVADRIDPDPGAGERWAEDMPERMRWRRANVPAHWSEKTRRLIVSNVDDVAHVSRSPKLFCSG